MKKTTSVALTSGGGFTAYAIISHRSGGISWPDPALDFERWDSKSLHFYKGYWQGKMMQKRRYNSQTRAKLQACIDAAQAELVRRALLS